MYPIDVEMTVERRSPSVGHRTSRRGGGDGGKFLRKKMNSCER